MLATSIYLIALFSSVLLHELGHVAVSKRYGIATIEIVMFPIGGLARLERLPKPHEELWIALAGPAVNVLIAGAIYAWLGWANDIRNLSELVVPTDRNLLQRIAIGNLILAGFNMLPAFPMDGGRVLRALLARWMGEAEATRKAAGAGQILAILMGLLGLLGGNFMLVFIALFVYLGAAQENAAVQGRFLIGQTPVRAAMITDFRTISHGSTLRDAADLLLASSQQDFPVTSGDQVLGLLTRNDLLRGMASEGAEAYVAGSMKRNYVHVAPESELAEAVPLLGENACVLVMEEDRLLGLLTRENVAEYLMLRRFGMDPRPA
jgi:Zn-dependent protease